MNCDFAHGPDDPSTPMQHRKNVAIAWSNRVKERGYPEYQVDLRFYEQHKHAWS